MLASCTNASFACRHIWIRNLKLAAVNLEEDWEDGRQDFIPPRLLPISLAPTMERRSAVKRRHVYADLNSSDATSTLPPTPAASSFIPTPAYTHRSSPEERPANLTIPPAYRQPFIRKMEASEEGRGTFGVTIRGGRKWLRQFTAGFRDAVRLSSSVNVVSR